MIKDREVCIFLTLRCNQHCKYCHRFLGIDEMDLEHNKKVISKIAEEGIRDLTFTGGEPLLYPDLIELVKFAKEKGMKIKIISNGEVLAKDLKMREIYNYLDSLTLSIDTIDNGINENSGRGYNHFDNVKTVLESLRRKRLKANINTVVNKMNLGTLDDLGNFLKEYNINTWRIFKFIPLRETAKVNKDIFEISRVDFRANRPLFTSFPNIQKIEFREENDMESKYVLIMPNGNVVITKNAEDVTIGNILQSSLHELLVGRKAIKPQNKVIEKIRTLVAYNNEQERNKILDKMRGLNYVEVVGTSATGIETYNEIVELKPEIVFSNYDLGDMDGSQLIARTKEKLNTEAPVFNFIASELPERELEKLWEIGDNKVTAVINETKKEKGIVSALEDYKKLKDM